MHTRYVFLMIIIISMIPKTAFAEKMLIDPWGAIAKGQADTFPYEVVDGKIILTSKSYVGDISHSTGGEKKLFIMITNPKETLCDPLTFRSASIAKFQGQAVKVDAFCNKYTDHFMHYITFTAASDAGKRYVYELFSRSAIPIKIEFQGDVFEISSEGFTAEWDKVGGDAL
jgi:hypothetical protein